MVFIIDLIELPSFPRRWTWADYFEDFPEENPANQVDGHYHPNGAAINMARAAARAKQENDQAALDAEIKLIIEKHSKPRVEKKTAGLTIAKLKYLDKLHERAEELAGYLLSRLSSTPNDQRPRTDFRKSVR